MARKAIAASLAAVVLLSVLVVADAAVVSGQDNLASYSQASRLESRVLLLERYSAGVASMLALMHVDDYLASNPAECGAISGYVGGISASASFSGVDSGVSFAADAAAAPEAGSPGLGGVDNLTTLAPFSGYRDGALNLKTLIVLNESSPAGSVSLQKREAHTLNVPVWLDSASSLCASSLSGLGSALARSPCNSTLEQGAFEAALPGLTAAASARGFTLTAGWSPASACSAGYWITLIERGVPGATGSFDWTVRGHGTTA